MACASSWASRASRGYRCCSRRVRMEHRTRIRSTPRSGCGKRPGLNPLAQVERAVAAGVGLRRIEKARVDALERGAVALVGTLDAERAHRQRLTDRLDAAVSRARALGLAEHVDVDLDTEHLLEAAHVAAAGRLVLVGVEKRAAHLDASARLDRLVAERTALPALRVLSRLGPYGHARKFSPV